MTQPWIITCETCQSRLRVRSEAAIGSILACPKCQSLVHVTPPQPAEPPAEAPAEPPGPLEDAPSGTSSSLLVKSAVVVAGLAVIIAGGLILRPEQRADAGKTEAAGDHPANQAPDPTGQITAAYAWEAEEEPDEQSLPAPIQGPEGTEREGGDRGDEDAGARGDGPAAEVDEVQEAATIRPPELPAAPVDGRDSGRPEPPSGLESPSDIPPVGVGHLDLSLAADPFTRQTDPGPEPLPTGEEEEPPADAAEVEPVAVVTSPRPGEPAASSTIRMHLERVALEGEGFTSIVTVDPERALELLVAEISFQEMPLVDVVRLIAEMTGVSLTITPDAYHAMRRAPARSLTGRTSETTAGKLLLTVLRQNGLGLEQRGDHLVITVPEDSAAGVVPDADALRGAKSDLPALDQPMTYSFTEATPLSDVLRHVERTAGITLLVDWESLAGENLGPGSFVTSSVVDQPLGEVLDELLPQIGLEWQVAGESALWITLERGVRRR